MRCTHTKPTADYRNLTNGELQRLLSDSIPEMRYFPVTDDTRETVIAMIKISQDVTKER